MSHKFHNIILYFLIYRVVSRLSFYVPIFIVALLSLQLSFLEIGVVLFIYGISTTFFGKFFQTKIAKNSAHMNIFYGEIFKFTANMTIGIVLFYRMDYYFIILLFAQFLGGVGYCFSAIGDGCYLSKVIDKNQMSKERQHLAQAKSSSYMFISFLFAGVVGAVIFQSMPSLPFVMTGVANMAAAMIALKFLSQDMPQNLPDHIPVQNNKRHIKLKFMSYFDIFIYSFLRSIVLVLQLFVFPVLFFLELKIDVSFFGLLFGMYTIFGFLGGRLYPYLLNFISMQTSVIFLISVTLLSMIATALSDVLWVITLSPIGIFLTAGMLRPAFLPVFNNAKDKCGKCVNLIPRAEQTFGALSALLYLICAVLYSLGYTSQRLMIDITGSIILLLIVKTALSVGAGMKKTNLENM